MHAPLLPLTRDLVLIGGGHTHALVLRKWGMNPLAGARVTVINPGPTAPYSGMLPGFVAGHYHRDDLDIDLVRLARFAGARVIIGKVEGLDPVRREIHVPGRPPVAYDVTSINVGITSDMPALPGFADHAIPAKPLGPFAQSWSDYLARTGSARVAVIGGGVAGAELAMAMAHALRHRGRDATVSIVDSATALSALGDRAAQRLRQALAGLDVQLIEQAEIASLHADHLLFSDGTKLEADFITGAAGARAYGWMAQTGLDLDDGFVKVNDYLQSSDPNAFAAGDCAHLSHDPRPKAGVYAVREAPVLYQNLRAALGAGQMRRYQPQHDYLKLMSLGARSALGERFGKALSGSLMWRWKDHIDQTFMNRFRNLPKISTPALPRDHADGMGEALGGKPLCGGCGAKVGRLALRDSLPTQQERADITPLPGDDAAVIQTGNTRQVMTTDHLRGITLDPVLMARIAAHHALGDIWAMGATPQAATATLILPRLSSELQRRTVAEIMQAAQRELRNAGAEIVGGHTSMGDEMTIGFTLTGLCERDPITLAGGKPGDALILTKPIGSGVILAAEMAGEARGEHVAETYRLMQQSQKLAAEILRDAHAMTDVTGFGLAGHLSGICEMSGTGAVLDLPAVPVLPGAEDLAVASIRSTLFNDNRALTRELPEGGQVDLLYDPQTAGGLVAAIAPDTAAEVLTCLQNAGYDAAQIGFLTEEAGLRLQS
ncbi:selenide, water dikinase SelD [Ruegeria sp. 2205SS24-7]|uniref:selenide, water dikinase SelD n=1 Tax=Ruegeria discodermiae TaxID=3064389 RepID=UPI002740BB98|nr:selenide, water dikinase SelD [Ruegeria sp. 2205SS24-7]MDP5216930.1 selenide, water dikinase SelD [Ruegeria sp. 2205SS24-7]